MDDRRQGLVESDEAIFKKAVVAAAFSPRLTAVLNEAHRILKLLGAWPIIVHVGEESPATRIRLEEAIDRSHFHDHPPICIVQEGAPADVLIDVAKQYDADLIVAGALAKEGLFKYYLGSVARSIARHAPCSVLLFTEPQTKPRPIERIHCAVEYREGSKKAIKVAARLAGSLQTKSLYFTHSFTSNEIKEEKQHPKGPDAVRRIYQQEDEKLNTFIKELGALDIPYETRCLYDQSLSTTLDFTREIKADLFIITGPMDRFSLWNRIFPQNLELALQHLPCDLLLIR